MPKPLYKVLNHASQTQIAWIVNRHHVGTPLHVVGRDILDRIRRSKHEVTDRTLIAEAIVFARRKHEANRDLYRYVTGGIR